MIRLDPQVHLQSPRRAVLFSAAALLSGWLGCGGAGAAEWKTGVDFRRQLEAPVGLQWSENPLRSGLSGLAEAQGVAIFLDRRVDPDQKVDFSIQGAPLGEALQQLAEQLDLGVGYVGPVVYFGPKGTAEKLATLAAIKHDEIRKLSPSVVRRLTRLQAWSWPQLSTPRDLVSQLAQSADVEIPGAQNIPHDLWPAVNLPPLSFTDRLSLVLAGFDVTFQVDEGKATLLLTAMPERPLLEKEYRAPGNTVNWPEELTKRYPQAKVTQQGRRILVAATWQEQEEIARLIRGESVTRRVPVKDGGKSVYTLNIEQSPVGTLAAALAERLNLEIEFDLRIDQQTLDKLVSLNVKNASRDDLLRAVLAPAGLRFELDGPKLRILPAATPKD